MTSINKHVFHPQGPYARMFCDINPTKTHRLCSVDGLARSITFRVPIWVIDNDEDEVHVEFDCGSASIRHIDYRLDGNNCYQLQHGEKVSFPLSTSRKIWLYFHNELKWYIGR